MKVIKNYSRTICLHCDNNTSCQIQTKDTTGCSNYKGVIKQSIEEAHSKWDKEDYPKESHSARQMPVGYINLFEVEGKKKKQKFKLVDKVLMPVNECCHCKSKNTFHSRMQKNKFMDNIYETKKIDCDNGRIFFKFDFCFECSRKFLFECFIYHKVKK